MATKNQINYIEFNKYKIKEPILIVGSKKYDFDSYAIGEELQIIGFKEIIGMDLLEGEGVDYKVDITDENSDFQKKHAAYFNTIICMEVLTHVRNPFKASNNITKMLKENGVVILSECIVRKISKIPKDLWRFTYDGTKELFSELIFDDSMTRMSLTRDKNEKLMPLSYPLPEILQTKNENESSLGFFLRRLHRKYFSNGIFKISRLIPEITIYSTAKKN